MESNTKKIGLINWIALAAAAFGMGLIGEYARSVAVIEAGVLAGFGLFVALMSYCQMSLEAREQLEKLELEELSKSRGGASLFATSQDDTFPARRSREQFERFFVPALSVVLLLAEAAGTYFPWRLAAMAPAISPDRAALAMVCLGLLAIILFLLGKYSAGLARLQQQRLLRGSGAYMVLSAYAAAAAVVALVIVDLGGTPKADMYFARGLCVIAGLIAVETFIGLVLEVYRVRVKGKETRLLYESRLVGLLGQPEAIITTAAHALDYQFGFKVSDTWFYRFLEKALAWIIIAQVAILTVSTCVVVIEPGEQALLERCGKPVSGREVIGPGLHFKLPWPVDQVHRYRTDQVQSFLVGASPEMSPTIQWTVIHAEEVNFLVANRDATYARDTNGASGTNGAAGQTAPPVNLLSVSIPVQFIVTNLSAWAYNNDDPTNMLQLLATREVVRFLASVDLENLMSQGRGAAATALRASIQAQSDARKLGAEITFVGLEDIHPPTKVAKEYERIVGAREDREVKILDAQAHSIQTNALARALAYRLTEMAKADKEGEITNAAARADLFGNQSLAYAAAPGDDGIYEHRAYLDVLIASTAKADKKVIMATASSTNQIFEFNFEDKIRDLGNSITVPSDNK